MNLLLVLFLASQSHLEVQHDSRGFDVLNAEATLELVPNLWAYGLVDWYSEGESFHRFNLSYSWLTAERQGGEEAQERIGIGRYRPLTSHFYEGPMGWGWKVMPFGDGVARLFGEFGIGYWSTGGFVDYTEVGPWVSEVQLRRKLGDSPLHGFIEGKYNGFLDEKSGLGIGVQRRW